MNAATSERDAYADAYTEAEENIVKAIAKAYAPLPPSPFPGSLP